ncbi:cytochrome d ubiquinol oxidase subunit II [Candidatus Sumerlaeota bacterium]|nr:cytochrome d ubiquinol oxidase subunit II [Candidatus Sumerlaeota bacterium]
MSFLVFDLNTIWFFLVGVLFTGYAMLDGFDLGAGILHLLPKPDRDRRVILNAIGPVWDGNEVWLVTGGGALFAAFPMVYATVFSGFYLAFMLLLIMLIFRAVAIEFRSKRESQSWRRAWDVAFFVSSLVSSLLIGVAMGNIACGIPLSGPPAYTYLGSFLSLLRPYPVIIGLLTVALFGMHGGIYLVMKTEGELHDLIRGWIRHAIIFFIVMFGIATLATLLYVEHMSARLKEFPELFIVPLLLVLAIANIPREYVHGRDFHAFLSSCAAMILLMMLFAMGMYPNMVVSLPDPENSLTIYNASSSEGTLKTMLIIALIGMPLVLSYTVSIYWVFRGKVKLEEHSY